MEPQRPDFREALRALAQHRVDFIVIGGVAAVLNGAPVSTFDLDIVHSRTETNLDRLVEALGNLGAYYREKPVPRVCPDRARLQGPDHHLLLTRAGPLDIIGTVVTGEAFEELLPESRLIDLGAGLSTRLLDLRSLIRIKEALGGERDLAVLPILRRTLAEQSRGPA